MAKRDISIKDTGGLNVVPSVRYQTEAGATDIYAGEPVKSKSAGSNYVIPLATGEPVIGTTTQVIGIAAQDSSHTATADGYMDVYVAQPNVVYECKATTSANIDTQAELDALQNDNVTFDLTSSTYTIDEDEGNDDPHGLQIVGGDPEKGTIYFKIRPSASEGVVA